MSGKIVVALSCWFAVSLAGMLGLIDYVSKHARADFGLTEIPAIVLPMVRAEKATVVMFVHPFCPCSRASLRELSRTTRTADVPPVVLVVFPAIEGESPIDLRAAVPADITTVEDYDGAWGEAFRASASGEVFAFNRNRELSFHGGITSARGHEGDCVGQAALRSVLGSGFSSTSTAPVFGCSLGPELGL